MARGNDEKHNLRRKVDPASFRAGDRVRYVTADKYGETHDYGTFATHAKDDPEGAYVQFDNPKKGAETYVNKSDLRKHESM